jgi:hypothetical protein
MKPGSDPIKKSDSDSVTEPGKDTQGIDFLKALQVIGGIIGAAAVVWIILRFLHIL